MLKAWGDESGSSRTRDPGAYLLGAVVIDEDKADQVRAELRSLLLRGQRKVHWVDESDRRRDEIIAVLSSLSLPGLVVTRVAGLSERDERRRRKCLDLFVHELAAMGCTYVTLESRGKKADERDLAFVQSQIGYGALKPGFHLSHATGPGDPLLWAADIAVGAAVAARTGRPQWLDHLVGAFKTLLIEDF